MNPWAGDRRIEMATLALIGVVLAQVAFWSLTRTLRVVPELVPAPPTSEALDIMALGDRQFLYRALGLEVQNFGDTAGRFTPLLEYDYARLGEWFERLDRLDPVADYAPAIAANYYGLTPTRADTRHIVTYLAAHARRDIARKWRWLAQAAYMARHKLKDLPLALDLARELAQLSNRHPGLPVWTRSMPAFILAEMGETEAARTLLGAILESEPGLSPEEVRGMRGHLRRWSRP
jgi:hypothetical protein